ncbi:MAG: hypothetical protein SWX82_26625 [Cyanobacteriota bacterium]|nr:hypothetical protein [Cyanobacteriota bacterium]
MKNPLLKLLNYPLNNQIYDLPELPINFPDGKVVLVKKSNNNPNTTSAGLPPTIQQVVCCK